LESDSLQKIFNIIKEVDDYLDSSDRKRLLDLLMSLCKFKNKTKGFDFKYHPIDKKTNSLYRFGWFEFNDELFFVYNWNIRKQLVTFLNQDETIKVIFSLEKDDFIKNKELLFPSFFSRIKKQLRLKIKKFLKELSEKL
jgi:hypothetical protein